MRRGGLIFGTALFALFGAPEGHAQYWHPRPRYWREAPPPPSRIYEVGRYRASYRDAPPPPPQAYMMPRYGAAYHDYPPPPPRYRAYRPRARCDRGSGGTILGAIAGGLLGNRAAGRGDRGVGTVLGAGAGALVGREVDRGC